MNLVLVEAVITVRDRLMILLRVIYCILCPFNGDEDSIYVRCKDLRVPLGIIFLVENKDGI